MITVSLKKIVYIIPRKVSINIWFLVVKEALNMGNRNYYMLITTPEDFEIDSENNYKIVGFPMRNCNFIKKFKKVIE